MAVEIFPESVTGENIDRLAAECDLLVDGLDNLEGRFVLNGFAVRKGVPYIYGAVQGWEGMTTLIHPPGTGCLSCLIPVVPPPPKDMIPVAGILPGTIGLIQAAEALKHLMGIKRTLAGRLLVYDGRDLPFDIVDWEKNPSCPACSKVLSACGSV